MDGNRRVPGVLVVTGNSETVELTYREAEIAYWVAQSKTNWEISQILGISSCTVRNHIHNILHKTAFVNRRVLQQSFLVSHPRVEVNGSFDPVTRF